ncbi:hypothetical protein GCM10007425_12000 [Lysinibacillus alkalisoli]|uniref:DNA/pantothenate metabolism flavoprotein C-terminal domain-containing protein n=1 Tax=Lysinibacillus alkalisoli TaxID=1911548 RepID=A0A917G246_9BACI|nr:hypothetical protein GCM10007425_12000 [Lysinibacillus alkalisoli]
MNITGKTVLITSGGTLEKWDNVRGHTNLSKGIMGCYLAEAALAAGANVIYVHGYFAKLPNHAEQMCLIGFEGIEHLGSIIQQYVQEEKVDIVIMAAAGSDWLVDKVFDQSGNELTEQGKMPSDEPPIIHFKKAPKILPQIKKWQPNVTLIGFKLEATTDEVELKKRAMKRMQTSQAQFMVANSSASLYGEHEPHWIIAANGEVIRVEGKEATAQQLMKIVIT